MVVDFWSIRVLVLFEVGRPAQHFEKSSFSGDTSVGFSDIAVHRDLDLLIVDSFYTQNPTHVHSVESHNPSAGPCILTKVGGWRNVQIEAASSNSIV